MLCSNNITEKLYHLPAMRRKGRSCSSSVTEDYGMFRHRDGMSYHVPAICRKAVLCSSSVTEGYSMFRQCDGSLWYVPAS